MTTRCTICGKKVPKKRATTGSSAYSGFFCSTACHLQYSDQMMKMMRETELEVEDELKRETGTLGSESWTAEALDALDKAAESATSGSRSPEEIAAKFLGAFAGKFGVKFATRLYGNFSDMAKEWARKRAEKAANPEPQPPPPKTSAPPPSTPPPPAAKAPPTGQTPKQTANGRVPPKNDPAGWKKIPEPEDLEELPLDEQKEWLLRRFYLPPTATLEDVKLKYRQVAKRYHPDNRATGNVKMMSVVNNTKSRLESIYAELETRSKRKKARSSR